MAGVQFEPLERLGTTRSAAAARELLVRQDNFTRARAEVERLLWKRGHGLSEDLFRAWRKAIRSGTMPPATDSPSRAFSVCWECASELAKAESVLKHTLEEDLAACRAALLTSARALLPPYLVFVAEGLRERLATQFHSGSDTLPPRKKHDRAHERHLLLYLQRICGKNDSLSEFGPEGWGVIEGRGRDLRLSPEGGVAKRETFLERWTAHGAAKALNADPEIRLELSPRIHPAGRMEENQFLFTDTGVTNPLDRKSVETLSRCDGRTPAYLFGDNLEVLERLAAQKIIRWEIEVPALDPHGFDVLLSDVTRWRDSAVRDRWLKRLQPIAALPESFAQTTDTIARAEIMDAAREQIGNLGATRTTADRFLYSATNPIGEECFRDCNFSIGEELINEVVTGAEPWIDLWRDTYAFVASRVAAGLRAMFEKAPLHGDALPLPAFLRYCESMKMPLTGPPMVGMAHLAFQEVKAAFRERMRHRPEAEEWELTAEDCHFVRRDFQYESFDEFTYPSADLQLEASSIEAVSRGEYRWIMAELHPPIALLHHGFYWSCPDKSELGRALAATVHGRPSFHFGFFAADFTSATAVRVLDAIPDRTSFIAPQRGDPRWRMIPPAEVEVFVDQRNGDVGLRLRESREYLGSFARAWVIPLGFHPFHLGRAPHMPRLLCGNIIVQRRCWVVRVDELAPGNYTGVSSHLVLAIEKLRSEKGFPRYVYIRPTEEALRRSGAEGRDKDTKPVFIDLESYLSLEIFHRWLNKSGELEVTEMRPDPDHLCWQEKDGRRTFELRTLIIPG